MKRIKPFSLFIESSSRIIAEPELAFIKTGFDGDYGVPRLEICGRSDLYSGGTWKDPDMDDRDELFDLNVEALYGPITGPDCWESIDEPRGDWAGAYDEEDKEEHKLSVRGWLADWGLLDDVDVDKFLEDDDYYEEVKNMYIENSREYFDRDVYTVEDVWNYMVIDFMPTYSQVINDFCDTSYNEGNLMGCVSDLVGKIFICLAYKKRDPNFYLLTKDNTFEDTPYTKSQSPEQIKDLVIKDNFGMVFKSIEALSEIDKRKYIKELPPQILDGFIESNPMQIDLLDEFPEIKKGVLQRTGIKDLSQVARSLRGGII
jgi:hypothetical protein